MGMDWFRNILDGIRMVTSSLSPSPEAWEWSIARFETEDQRHTFPRDAIVFTGSSSITLWNSLAQDMAPLPVINRGFGGSKIDQVAHYIDRIVTPYHPRAVVLFAGTNDISGSKPRTAKQVFEGYQAFVKAVHSASPETPIYFISITPTPLRWKLWPTVDEANQLIRTFAGMDQRLHFIDLTDQFLTAEGIPDRRLYRIDRLHPNKKGYARWVSIIKPILQSDLG